MPPKGKGRRPPPAYQLKNKALFQAIIESGKPLAPAMEKKKFCGFPLRNVNQLWRWDTLQDVTF